MTYDSLLDERCITIVESLSTKRHVKGWFETTVCGKYCGDSYSWEWVELTSLRYLAKISQNNPSTTWCKRCLSNYKDVKI